MRSRITIVSLLVLAGLLIHSSIGPRQALAATPPQHPSDPPVDGVDPAASGQSIFVYMPALSVPDLDLVVTGLEVNQGVQHQDNSVPLVAGRLTLARVYVSNSAGKTLNNVTVQVTASRAGVALAGVAAVNGNVLPTPARGTLAASFNVTLPADWLAGDVQLVAAVDPNNAIPESNETNNSFTFVAHFNPVPEIKIVLFPINYTDAPTGRFFPGRTVDPAHDFMLKTYPISALTTSFRPAIDFSGDLSQEADWTRLLDQLLSIKNADGAPKNTRYLGLIPTINAGGDTYQTTLDGLAYGSEDGTAIASDNAPATVAHELGHTYDLPHAPCGNPDGPDPAYPYADASIGDFGLDIGAMRLWSPSAPDNTRDIMSYCEPVWFSDYNYKKLLTAITAAGTNQQVADDAATGTRLLIRFAVGSAGQLKLKPIYAFSSRQPVALPVAGDYTIELLGLKGQVLASYPTRLNPLFDSHSAASTLNVVVPVPAAVVSQVRVNYRGTMLAQRMMLSTATRSTRLQPSSAGWVLQFNAAARAKLVRYTADAGKTWTTLAIDAVDNTVSMNTLPAHAQIEVTYGDGAAPEPWFELQ